jgi:hypothetical protein
VSRWRRCGTFASRCGLGAVAAAMITAAPAVAQEPWGFEQVTPVSKGEGTVSAASGFRTSPDGNVFLYMARLPFSGAPTEAAPLVVRYGAVRGEEGWHNRGLDAPKSPSGNYFYGVLNSSQDASHVIVGSDRALTPGATEGGGNLYVRNTRTGAYTLVATSPDQGLSRDGGNASTNGPTGHAFVANDGRSALFSAAVPLRPGDPGGVVYRWTADGGLEAMSILPENEGGGRVPGATLGAELAAARDAMPVDDGHALDRVYFQTYIETEFGTQASGVYVREGGETRLISRSRLPGAGDEPHEAVPDAASDGGRYLTFHTTSTTLAPIARLTPDTPASDYYSPKYIYRYDAVTDELRYVGTGSAVYQMSRDGKTIVFNGGGEAQTDDAVDGWETGVANLYAWRDDGSARGSLRLITATDPYSSAAAGENLRRLSPNGRYLAYTDTSPSVAARFGLDNVTSRCPATYTVNTPAPCTQVYLYDTVTDELACVSCRTDGQVSTGHAGDPYPGDPPPHGWVEVDHYQARTVTDDGTVFFGTPDSLLPGQDNNGQADVYAYRDGALRLVSRGMPDKSSRFLDATPDGKTVFLSTSDPIAVTDTDGEVDIYMTRAGAGYPGTSAPMPSPCAGSDCREPAGAPAPAIIAATIAFPDSGNPSSPLRAPVGKVSVAKVKAVKGSVASLSVKVPSKGRVRTSGSGLVTATRAVSEAGSHRIRVALTAAGKRTLARGRSVTRRVTVTFTPSGGRVSSVTVSLTFKPIKNIKKGQQS